MTTAQLFFTLNKESEHNLPQVTKHQLLPLPQPQLMKLPSILVKLLQLLLPQLLLPQLQEVLTTNKQELLSSNIKDSSQPVPHTHNNSITNHNHKPQLSTKCQLLQLPLPQHLQLQWEDPETAQLKFKSQLTSELSLSSLPLLSSSSSSSSLLVSSANNSESNNNTCNQHHMLPKRWAKETSTEYELNREILID